MLPGGEYSMWECESNLQHCGMCVYECASRVSMWECGCLRVWRGRGLGSSAIFKNLMMPTPRRKWYLTTGRRAH